MTAWLDGGDKGWMWLMGVGRTGESPGQMWRGEEREPDTAGKMSCQSHLSNLGVENAHCLMHLPTLPLQAGFQRSQVKLRAVKFWASPPHLLCLSGRGSFMISFWFMHFPTLKWQKKKGAQHSETSASEKPAPLLPSPILTPFPLYLSSWWVQLIPKLWKESGPS